MRTRSGAGWKQLRPRSERADHKGTPEIEFRFLSPAAELVRHVYEAWPHGAVCCENVKRSAHVAKFLFVYRSEKDSREALSPEEMQRIHAKWQAWIAEGFQKGWMLDAGNGLKTE